MEHAHQTWRVSRLEAREGYLLFFGDEDCEDFEFQVDPDFKPVFSGLSMVENEDEDDDDDDWVSPDHCPSCGGYLDPDNESLFGCCPNCGQFP